MTEPTAPHATPRNPGPRPALQRRADDDTVISARPRAGTAPATADTLAAPLSSTERGVAEAAAGKAKDSKEKDKEKVKAGRAERASKDGKKHKDSHRAKEGKSGKHPKDHHKPHQEGTVAEDRELTVVLPKAVRRALNDSAAAHGTTPELLVALVLNEWLDH